MTFYYHFKDIYDLVEWACLEDARRALDEKRPMTRGSRDFCKSSKQYRKNKPFILNVYRCVHREQVEKYLQPLVDQLLLDVINEEAAGMTLRDEDKQFIAKVYAYIFIGVMLDWIKNDMRENPQEIVSRLGKLLQGSVTAAISRFRVIKGTLHKTLSQYRTKSVWRLCTPSACRISSSYFTKMLVNTSSIHSAFCFI